MTTKNVFEFIQSEKEKDKIFHKFCVKVKVFGFDGSVRKQYYCLHCQKLYCRSGFHRHSTRTTVSQEDKNRLAGNFFKHVKMHETKVAFLLEKSGSRGLIRTTTQPEVPHFFTLPLLQRRAPERRVRTRVQRPVRRRQSVESDQLEILESAPDSGHDPGPHDDLSDHPE